MTRYSDYNSGSNNTVTTSERMAYNMLAAHYIRPRDPDVKSRTVTYNSRTGDFTFTEEYK